MVLVTLSLHAAMTDWPHAVQHLLAGRIPPELVQWQIGPRSVLPPLEAKTKPPRMSARLMTLGQTVTGHSDPDRFNLMYRLIWQSRLRPEILAHDTPLTRQILNIEHDVQKAQSTLKRRLTLHKIAANPPFYAGWSDCPQDPLELALPHFRRRFSDFDWAVFTPTRMAVSTGGNLHITLSPPRPDLPRNTAHPDWAMWLGAYTQSLYLSA